MDFVAFLGKDKENWGQVVALLKRMEYGRAFIVKAKGTDNFPGDEKTEVIEINSDKPLLDLKRDIMDKLKDHLRDDFDVSLSLASGNGKEHMALISALLSVPVGIRLVVYTKEGVEVIN